MAGGGLGWTKFVKVSKNCLFLKTVSKNCLNTIFWVPRNVFVGGSGSNSNSRMKSFFYDCI